VLLNRKQAARVNTPYGITLNYFMILMP